MQLARGILPSWAHSSPSRAQVASSPLFTPFPSCPMSESQQMHSFSRRVVLPLANRPTMCRCPMAESIWRQKRGLTGRERLSQGLELLPPCPVFSLRPSGFKERTTSPLISIHLSSQQGMGGLCGQPLCCYAHSLTSTQRCGHRISPPHRDVATEIPEALISCQQSCNPAPPQVLYICEPIYLHSHPK